MHVACGLRLDVLRLPLKMFVYVMWCADRTRRSALQLAV